MELSPDQAEALDRVESWFRAAPASHHCDDEACDDSGPHTHGRAVGYPVLAVGGLAGTGKTWLTGQLASRLGLAVAYGTPTHRAAAVLRSKLPAGESSGVNTYHSLLYQALATFRCGVSGERLQPVRCGCEDTEECDCDQRFLPCGRGVAHACPVTEQLQFRLRRHVGGHRDLVVLDEASMVSEQRVKEISSLGVPVLLVGDHGQLPPVKEPLNPWMLRPHVVLETNHRQGEASGIVDAALTVRRTGHLPHGAYGDGSTVCASARDHPAILDAVNPTSLVPGTDTAVITHTNRVRAAVNQQFRTALGLGDDGSPASVGDRVTLLQNRELATVSTEAGTGATYGDGYRVTGGLTFVANGTSGTVRAVQRPHTGSRKYLDLVVELDADQRGRAGKHVLTRAVTAQLGSEKRLRPDEYPAGLHLWDHAYAVTAHKAQGSEFSRVAVLDTYPPDHDRWLYTAITRAREKLLVVNWR